MSETPRFENVDLTPTWDDVDPAALDFGADAVEIDVDVAELNPQPLPPVAPDTEPVEVEAEAELEPEPAFAVEVPEDDAPDEGAFWEQADQFDGGIGPENLPDDFDL